VSDVFIVLTVKIGRQLTVCRSFVRHVVKSKMLRVKANWEYIMPDIVPVKKFLFNLPRLGISAYRSDIRDYMCRWIFRTPWGMLRLHKILRSDEEGLWHNHPSWLCSFILAGIYEECRAWLLRDDGGFRVEYRPVRSAADLRDPCRVEEGSTDVFGGGGWREWRDRVNFIPANRFHRIEVLDGPVWSLVLMGPIMQRWGFVRSDGVYHDFEQHRAG